MSKSVLFVCFSTVLLCPSFAWAWGCEGHQVIAYIAEHELTPTALSQANALLNSGAIDIHRNCTVSAGTTPMSDAATWADDVRFSRRDTAAWHFIDVPLEHAGEDPKQWCNNDCVLSALKNQLAILRDDSAGDSTERVEALRFIIHFVGDVHQPLHAATDSDRGGNCDPLTFDRKPHSSRGSYSPELHGIWDTQMVVELGDKSQVDDAQSLAQLLDKEITDTERSSWTSSTPTDWAIESTRLAVSTAYVGLTKADGTMATSSDFVNSELNNKCDLAAEKRIVAMGVNANEDYRVAAEAVIEQRLKQAGVRLAKLLNDTWPDDSATAHRTALHRSSPQ
jgi:hypothetical protein